MHRVPIEAERLWKSFGKSVDGIEGVILKEKACNYGKVCENLFSSLK
jgi:hypothetical protein